MNSSRKVKDNIRIELGLARTAFQALLGSLSENDLRKQSLNPGWTNGEILAHMTFGFVILSALLPMTRLWGYLPKWTSKPFAALLDAGTGLFNRINALGARMQAHVFTCQRIGRLYDQVYFSLIRQIGTIKDAEWQRGMYYPTRWDPNFREFMTVEELFRYAIKHFDFHLGQIAR